jgi:hypothetical protein
MQINSGNVSLILGVLFILIALGGFLVFVLLINNKGSDPARLDKLIDIWKWTLGTFLLSVCSFVISDSFKQREADKSMMTSFNQYINIVVDTGTLDKKWQLCMFFIAVSPEGEMRNAWLRYKDTLISSKNQLANLNGQEKKINTEIAKLPAPTPTLINSLNLIQDKKQEILSTLNATEPGNYLIIVNGNKDLEDANRVLNEARKINQKVVLYKKGNMYRTVFNGLSSRAAQDLLSQVRARLNNGAYIVKQSNWCPTFQTTPDCFICNP